WFKRDLRVDDHRALAEAAVKGPVLPLYVFEESLLAAPDTGARHLHFIREALEELNEALTLIGSPLVCARGEVVDILHALRAQFPITLWSHEETGNALTFARDRAVAAWANTYGVSWNEFPQNGVVRGLRDRDAWHRQWEKRMRTIPAKSPRQLQRPPSFHIQQQLRGLPELPEIGYNQPDGEVQRGGISAAKATLDSFLDERGARYSKEMSSPLTAEASCSRLSPHLAWGCLSMRQVVQAARQRAAELKQGLATKTSEGAPYRAGSLRSFLSRCHWHCHFIQKLEREPAIEYRSFHPYFDSLRRGESEAALLEAWLQGQTGYPFVDACLRFLRARGWINFRMRAMLTSFAAYDLWLDWRDLRDPLACLFTDYEPGIHYSQLQMQSGVTGINTLRIYNPIKQGHDHDAKGSFIRRWVPELEPLSTEELHEPWKAAPALRKSLSYPLPIVDHGEAVRHARRKIAEVRRQEGFREASADVYKRHGSRMNRENRSLRAKAKPAQLSLTLEGNVTAS
ncbi:MAG: FAD-binding domain-containing protein, partial [Verrucomicrobiota bacterium]